MASLFLAFTEHVCSVSFVSSPWEGFLRALLLCKGVVINVGASPIAQAILPHAPVFFLKLIQFCLAFAHKKNQHNF